MPRRLSEDEFVEFMVSQVPAFDEMIMNSIRPTDGWVILDSDYYQPDWMPGEVAWAMAYFKNMLTASRREE